MTFVVLGVVAVLVATGSIAFGALRSRRSFATANEIVAGTPSRAPAAWAGAHTPEALLHRRLGAAVDAARAQFSNADPGFADVTAAIGRGAQEVDDRLIAAAALPRQHRDQAIAELEPSVVAIEDAVAGLNASMGSSDQAALDGAVAEAHARLDALAEARAEVDQVDITEPRPAIDGGTSAGGSASPAG